MPSKMNVSNPTEPYIKMAKMVNFTLHVFCHDLKKRTKSAMQGRKRVPTQPITVPLSATTA